MYGRSIFHMRREDLSGPSVLERGMDGGCRGSICHVFTLAAAVGRAGLTGRIRRAGPHDRGHGGQPGRKMALGQAVRLPGSPRGSSWPRNTSRVNSAELDYSRRLSERGQEA
jgi:hypothetical protein